MVNDKLIEHHKRISVYTIQIIFFFIASICVGIGIYEIIPLNHVLGQSFHVNQQQVVLIGSTFSLGYAVGFLIFGYLANCIETRKLLTVGLLLLMVSTFVTGFATTYTLMMILRTIQGILGQLYGSLVISLYPWANVFWLQSLIYAVIIIFMVFLVPKTGKTSTKTTKTNFSAQLAKLLINKSLLPCYIITVTLLFSFVGMYTVMGGFFQKSFGFDSQKILWIRGTGIIGMIGSMLFVKLSSKLGTVNILSLGLICASISVLIIGISNHVILSIVMSIIFVFGITVSLPMIVSLIGVRAGKQSGNAMTLYTFVLFIGATIGPIICNHIMNTSGSYSLTFIFLAIVLCISFLVSLMAIRPYKIS